MSYNCTTWKTTTLDKFRLPIASLYKHPRSDWHPERRDVTGLTMFAVCEAGVSGHVNGDWLEVTSVDIAGEGSGTALNWIFEPAFEHSTGTLVATLIWEGGDSIQRLSVVDGQITTEEIDI